MAANSTSKIILDTLSLLIITLFAMVLYVSIRQGVIYSTRDVLLSVILAGASLPLLLRVRLPVLRILAILILLHVAVLYLLTFCETAITDKDTLRYADSMAAEVWPKRKIFAFRDGVFQTETTILVVHYGEQVPFAEKVSVFKYRRNDKDQILEDRYGSFSRISGGVKYTYPLLYF